MTRSSIGSPRPSTFRSPSRRASRSRSASLTAGRRLLSDDRAALETIAVRLGRRIDALRITRERYERELHEQEISKLATEAELRALRSQINPHFLFNALTTIGYLIQTSPTRALETLMRLTSLLRGVLRSEGELTTLGREIEIVEAYLEIERAQIRRTTARVASTSPPRSRTSGCRRSLLQPLVENAVKHGIAPDRPRRQRNGHRSPRAARQPIRRRR